MTEQATSAAQDMGNLCRGKICTKARLADMTLCWLALLLHNTVLHRQLAWLGVVMLSCAAEAWSLMLTAETRL